MAKYKYLIYDFDVSGKSIGVSFVGVPGINNAMKNNEYLELFNSADICSIDGAPVAKLAQKAPVSKSNPNFFVAKWLLMLNLSCIERKTSSFLCFHGEMSIFAVI